MEIVEREIMQTLTAGIAISGVIFERQWEALTSRNPVTGEAEGVVSRAFDKGIQRVVHFVRR